MQEWRDSGGERARAGPLCRDRKEKGNQKEYALPLLDHPFRRLKYTTNAANSFF